MAHEAVEPTAALDLAVDKMVQPVKKVLSALVAELLGASPDAVVVRDCATSVLAMCGNYYHSAAFVQRMDHLDVHDPATIEHLAEHVFRFSLNAIRGMAQEDGGRDSRVGRVLRDPPTDRTPSGGARRARPTLQDR